MNIEEAIDNVKFIIGDLKASNYNETFITAIETLLTAYENLKSYNKGTKEALRVAEDLEHQANKEAGDWEARCFELESELEKEKEKNKELEEYKHDAELTKVACCTAQNCEALNNCIKLKRELQKLEDKIKAKIEELEKEYKEAYNKGFKTDMVNRLREIKLMQSLLEKE